MDQWVDNLRENYYDLAEVVASAEAYTDFEGFTDHGKVLEIVDNPEVVEILDAVVSGEKFPEVAEAKRTLIRDLTIHWVLETMEQAEPPTISQTVDAVATIAWFISCRWWMRTDVEPK